MNKTKAQLWPMTADRVICKLGGWFDELTQDCGQVPSYETQSISMLQYPLIPLFEDIFLIRLGTPDLKLWKVQLATFEKYLSAPWSMELRQFLPKKPTKWPWLIFLVLTILYCCMTKGAKEIKLYKALLSSL